MDFLWVAGTIAILCWRLHKHYPGAVLLVLGVICLPIIGCYLPRVFFGENDIASQIGGAIGVCLEYPFIMTYLHFWWFVPPIKRRIVAEETEKIINDKKRQVRLTVPQEHEIESIARNNEYFAREYGMLMPGAVPKDNAFIDPESIWYYKTNRTIRDRAIEEWRRVELDKIDEERETIEASCLAKIEDKRWFKKKKSQTKQGTATDTTLSFADMVRSRVQSISPTDRQLAHFMSQSYVPDSDGRMTKYTVDEWLKMFSRFPEKKNDAIIQWRDECEKRIIAAGKWPDGFHGYSDDLLKS